MATTTNYGWTTPNDTDLVKDGAAAIRTLGSSIDTTTKALNPSTTLGDIEYRSATANTNTRLGIGSNGQYLTITGGVPAWGAISAGGMTLLSTTTLSGATVTISSINQTYNDLVFIISGATNATTTGAFLANPNNASTAQTGFTERSNNGGRGPSSNIALSPDQDLNRTDANNAFILTINNYASTSAYKTFNFVGGFLNGGSERIVTRGAGILASNTAVSSIVFSNAGGNLSTGTVLLYGVK
jgi:hypothetical protein